MTQDIQWSWQTICPPRVARGLLAGAAAGALSMVLWFLAVAYSSPAGAGYDVLMAIVVFVAAFFFWGFGLFAFGLIPWWLIHRIGFRGPLTAAVFGFAMTFLVNLCLNARIWALLSWPDSRGSLRSADFSAAICNAALIAPIGAIVAVVVWRTAYRSAADPRSFA
jgi:hypothetical protein